MKTGKLKMLREKLIEKQGKPEEINSGARREGDLFL